MILDLGSLSYRVAIEIIEWCYNHDIDKDKCSVLMNAMTAYPTPEVEWTLEIPEELSSMVILRWQ